MTVAVISGLSAAATLAVLFHASSPAHGESRSWLGLALFAAWAVLPYGALAWLGVRSGGNGVRASIVIAGAVLLCTAALYLYYQAFFVELDPQSGLVFLFVPAYQLVAIAAIWAVSRLPRSS